jgi:hypothetical protein
MLYHTPSLEDHTHGGLIHTGQGSRKGHMVTHRWVFATQGRGLGKAIRWHTQMDGCYTGQRPRKGHMVAHTDGWLLHRAEA